MSLFTSWQKRPGRLSPAQNHQVQSGEDIACLCCSRSLSSWCSRYIRVTTKEKALAKSHRIRMDDVDAAVDIVVLGHSVGDCLEGK